MRRIPAPALVLMLLPGTLAAQEPYKAEVHKEHPPAGVAPEIGSQLADHGFRILDDSGKPFADLWLRNTIPAAEKPAGARA